MPPLYYDIHSLDNRDPRVIAVLAAVLWPLLDRYFQPVVRGLERLPAEPSLLVGNHSGGLLAPDGFVFGCALAQRSGADALPYFLAHEVVMRMPGFNELLAPLGAICAGRDGALRVFGRGRSVLVFPGGDLDAFRSFGARDEIHFGERRGYIRLALLGGVPITPVVTAGAHHTLLIFTDGRDWAQRLNLERLRIHVLPFGFSLPWGFGVPFLPHWPLPSRIFQEVLEPVYFERSGAEAAADADYVEECHRRVLEPMAATLRALAAERSAVALPNRIWNRVLERLAPAHTARSTRV